MTSRGRILEINGPLVTARLPHALTGEQVSIGELGLTGEVLGRRGENAILQAYESTENLRPGDGVQPLGHPLSVELGPGLLGRIFDGVQRPLADIARLYGDTIPRGVGIPPLDREASWSFSPRPGLAVGERIGGSDSLGEVPETASIVHHILMPPQIAGELVWIAPAGDYGVDDTIARVRDASGKEHDLRLFHRWPVREPRPYKRRDHAVEPLVCGQRILDLFFPVLKGGKAAIPGPFGAGKTILQHQIARWSDADIVIYVGCGERGNELVDVLDSFPGLTDPHTGRSLMERTLLVANTSNMPVVAREASIYVGVTLAEYYRDQGFHVVMVADSTSRWAEALREVGGRLGEMPVEEGYPAYLASRLSAFYERAGKVETLSGRRGSVTLVGAVSPPGGDFSEPVTSHTKQIVRAFWALSKGLADARHYPAIAWSDSFSDYVDIVADWWAENVNVNWARYRAEALDLLTQADELARIVNLVGPEALSRQQRWVLEMARLIREGLLQQSALDETDSYASVGKQFELLKLMHDTYNQGKLLLEEGIPVQVLLEVPQLTRIIRARSLFGNDELDAIRALGNEVSQAFQAIRGEYDQVEQMQ
ncbi:MAG: V-type ATP synthase subunit A [Gammaproteobacteria bacterium]|jgi:V/A-type H+/Na+-transporting ATPase subunit A